MKPLRCLLLAVPVLLLSVGGAAAHTEPDVVAVPAGSTATVTLHPTHGCGSSPTTKVSTRVPVAGATAGAVEGWTATVAPDGERTVVEWTGGSLPTDQEGAFPVTFAVPDTVGELVLLPFVQECADGTELAWISGDPESEHPAPRVLVLAAGAAPAATIDQVPLDAPGRDQLLAVVADSDNPAATTTTAASTTTTVEGAGTTAAGEDDDGSDVPWLPIASGVVAVAGLTAFVVARRGGLGG